MWRKNKYFSRAKAQRRKEGSNTLSAFPALRDFFLCFHAKTQRRKEKSFTPWRPACGRQALRELFFFAKGNRKKDFLKLQRSSQIEGAAIGRHDPWSWVASGTTGKVACIGQVVDPSFERMLLPEIPTGRKILHTIGRN
jgi:hypothetical protein